MTGAISKYVKYLYEDALWALQNSRPFKSSQRDAYETKLIKLGILTKWRQKENEEFIRKIAFREPVTSYDGEIVFNKNMILEILKNIDNVSRRIDKLFTKVHIDNPIEKAVEIKQPTYTIPYLSHLIRRSAFQKAALEYHNDLKRYSGAYSLRLEVVCQGKSIQTAFQEGKFNPRLFILPKKLNGRSCYAVFWGLYSSHKQARNALSNLPSFFNEQKFPPVPVLLRQYLRQNELKMD